MKELETERGTEQVIREKFGVVKKGESVVVVVDETPESHKDETKEGNSLTNFFKKLFGKTDKD